MLVENQFINVKVNRNSIQHYLDKGYQAMMSEKICVKAEDLTHGSEQKVMVKCDYCGDVCEKLFNKFIKQRKYIKKDSCFKCFPLKQKDVVRFKYGVDSTMQIEENKIKSRQTIMERYGVENVMQHHEIQERFTNSMLERHGVEYAQQSDKIKEKTASTLMDNYGVHTTFKSDEINKRIYESKTFINGIIASKSQIKISDYFCGHLNVMICGFFVDILIDNDIVIEYNGSGHDLSVQIGKKDPDVFLQKDKKRIETLNENGYKCLVICNNRDLQITPVRLKYIKENIDELIKNNFDFITIDLV